MRVIITGAASGIGLATARRLANNRLDDAPPSLLLADINAESLDAAATELRETGAEVVTCVADLSDPAACHAVVGAAGTAFGGLDGLVSNAGMLHFSSLLDLTIDQYERIFSVNTRATWLLVKEACGMLKESRGSIVATASCAAHDPVPAAGAYAPSKAALLMLMRQFACELGPYGVRCNTISPGSTQTNVAGRTTTGDPESARPAGNPLGFISDPDDQAAVIEFLLSKDARFINGTDIVVDGGRSATLLAALGK